jgi:ribose 5-phosphate isomerase A
VKNTSSNPASKRFAAVAAARLIQDGMVVGIGTGSTMAFLIEALAQRITQEGIHIVGVPTSYQSRLLCMKLGIPTRDMQDTASVDLAVDGADEVDPNLDLIKGGGASHTREKIVAAMAREFVIVVDESKLVDKLGSSFAIPVEVLPTALAFVENAIRHLGGDPVLRIGLRKDGPVVTDNGQFLFDVRFPPTTDLRTVDQALHATPGIIETGLFFGMATTVLAGMGQPSNLTLKTLTRSVF